MESPVKKLDFSAGKENKPLDGDFSALEAQMDAHVEAKQELAKVAPTVKPDEVDEPLLQENPNRFVLFPIKYDEVRVASPLRVPLYASNIFVTDLANVQEGHGVLLDRRGD